MKLEEFVGSPNRVERDVARITLNYRGVMRLNKLAWEMLETSAAVKLLFDGNEMIIALNAEDPRRRNAFELKPKDRGRNRILHALPFCKHFNIKVERTVLFNDMDMQDGTMLLWLNNTTTVGKGWVA